MLKVKIFVKIIGNFIMTVGIVFLTVPITLWIIDRDPPYYRLYGTLDAGRNMECGPDAAYFNNIQPGGCVAVEWTIDIDRTKIQVCRPVSSLHVSRTITDANGIIHNLPKTERFFGKGKQPFTEKIRRPFVYPKEINTSGPAIYHSEACFVCNPVQQVLNWPVCITTPDVYYEVP